MPLIVAEGAQWLSGRVVDWRPGCRVFEPHRRYCVVSLSKTHLSLLSTGSTLAQELLVAKDPRSFRLDWTLPSLI